MFVVISQCRRIMRKPNPVSCRNTGINLNLETNRGLLLAGPTEQPVLLGQRPLQRGVVQRRRQGATKGQVHAREEPLRPS